MKETFEQKLKKAAQGIRMSKAEKNAMRLYVLRAIQKTPSPYFFYSFQFFMSRAVATTLVLALLVGGGTVYAAEGTLPGDVLYVVKISINETAEEMLAFSPAAKASVSVEFASRRIEEAEALAVQGKLTADLSATLEERFAAHAERADLLASELEEDDPESAAEVRAQLRSSLSAHGAILAQLGDDSDDKEVRKHSAALATRVLAHASTKGPSVRGKVEISQAVSLAITREVASTTLFPDFVVQRVAARFEKKANEALKDVQEKFEESKVFLTASTTARVEIQIAVVEALLKAGDAAGAFEAALQLKAFIKAERKFNRHLIEPLLRSLNDDDSNDGENDGENDGAEDHEDDGDDNGGNSPRIEIHL